MLLKGALTGTLDPIALAAADLRLENGRIAERAPALTPRPGEEVVELGGALVLPGFVNAHTHLYSALARGMPPPASTPANFVEILEKVWWRLDRALDEESVHLSGLAGAIEAALSGTTLLIDHHASPSFIKGSLGVLERALDEVGLRGVLCYEVTDRNGAGGRDHGIEETTRFAAGARSETTRGMIGAHASFTLSDETLARLRRATEETGTSLHIHVAEDKADVDDCRRRHGCSLPERLERHGLLHSRAILAHGVHLTPDELDTVHKNGGWIAHNPRSNMNNAVGYAGFGQTGRVALGTDGMDQDVLAEMRAAFLKMREANRSDAYGAAVALVAGGHRLAAAIFGLPFGALAPGGPADLAICDYDPPTELHADNLAGHLLFGLDRSHVSSVLVAGRFVLRDRRLALVDERQVHERVRRAASDLWQRMQMLP
jgi:putative selenium metabolism protein SsnA